MIWNENIGGYEELDYKTRDDINDWADKNGLNWAGDEAKAIQGCVIAVSAHATVSKQFIWATIRAMMNT